MADAEIPTDNKPVEDARRMLEQVFQTLARHPEAIRVDAATEGAATVFAVRVAEADIDRVIGEGERTINALRSILGAMGMRNQHRFALDIEVAKNG